MFPLNRYLQNDLICVKVQIQSFSEPPLEYNLDQ